MRPSSDVEKFVSECFANASDEDYRPSDLSVAVRRYQSARKVAGAEDSAELQDTLAEVVQVAASLWKQLRSEEAECRPTEL